MKWFKKFFSPTNKSEESLRLLILEETVVTLCEEVRRLRNQNDSFDKEIDNILLRVDENQEVLEALANIVLLDRESSEEPINGKGSTNLN